MIDNPFAEPDDAQTVVRPSVARTPPSEETVFAPRARAPRAEPVELAASGRAALLDAAAPLLQLLARLRNTLTPPDPGNLRDNAAQEIRRFEQRTQAAGLPPDLVRLAHYALCASLDDVVLNTPWGSDGGWHANSLVSGFHHEVRGGERFFELLATARENPSKFLPVLELMHQCLSLGFMGRYRLSPRGPAEIDRLREEIFGTIASLRPHADGDLSPAWRGVEAPYRPSRGGLPVWVAAVTGLSAVAGVFAWASVSLNAASDEVYDRAMRMPPVSMPVIARTVAVAAPAQLPGALDRLRSFLKPEVDMGLVDVVGTTNAPTVRIRQAGMFGPGSASLAMASAPLLQRIGAALDAEPGAVQVVGYTDDTPIRTARFPSNFQLSTARATAAAAVIARSLGDAARISAEGRADADPIASNATPEGRDANRRIEVTLIRRG